MIDDVRHNTRVSALASNRALRASSHGWGVDGILAQKQQTLITRAHRAHKRQTAWRTRAHLAITRTRDLRALAPRRAHGALLQYHGKSSNM